MDPTIFIFLSSGLFLGWSLGANDAANVFGTAVGSRMVRFGTAALICSVCLALGAVFGGAGATHGLGKLGQISTLAGAFTVALSAAATVMWMTRAGLPVSTSQAIVGAIVGWNMFAQLNTDKAVLSKIAMTWIACPVLGAVFAMMLYQIIKGIIYLFKPHLLRQDQLTRYGLVLAGALGSYSLGANNIGNVMGVFVPSSPFTDLPMYGDWILTSTQQLFLLGAIAIGVGVFTYSKKVMMTVGDNLMPLSPVAALVVVVAHSMVLFVFSSTWLQETMVSMGLFKIPLIPVSSSQAVIGAVIGIGMLKGIKGVRQIRWMVLLNIAGGWMMTPIAAAILCYVFLFVMQNVFNQVVM
ncbi:MAG TPA: inorganic phosphate transporter [Phycisphaerales bacterium]|nr:inorganic phosphate transporter [Phycisphaerales bacterium]HCD35369.1 inorganic phosphate transporter [Phycisphaerales bacterium]|tara:strand:+ start:344 stop:1402 length:1059 start_codon:yes stop_codon:yes gene_type:complete